MTTTTSTCSDSTGRRSRRCGSTSTPPTSSTAGPPLPKVDRLAHRQHPAVDVPLLPGDPGPLVAAEEDGDGGNVLDRSGPLERDVGGHHLLEPPGLAHVVEAVGVDDPWADGVDPDAVGPELTGRRLGECV